MASTNPASKEQKDPRTVHDLVSLITSSTPLGSTSTKPITIYPNDDSLLSLLHARFRHDLPFTRIGSSALVAVNPSKLIPADNEASMREIAEKAWDMSGRWRKDGGLQAHAYEFATRIYLASRRWHQPQLVVFRGITGSGKSHTSSLITRQLLHLSSSTSFTSISSTSARKAQKITSQINAFNTLLSSFGRSKTQANPDASRYSSYTELHFSYSTNDQGEASPGSGVIVGAKILTWGIDKSRLSRLRQDERTFHIFYQLLSGLPSALHESFGLEDASDYALLASSGCYRLPSGPFSDDSAQFGLVQEAMNILGFKERHRESIWRLLSAMLTLGNIDFDEPLSKRDVQAGYMGGANGLGGNVVDGQEEVRITNPLMLDRAARLLGITPDSLREILTVKSSYVRKEVLSVYLEAQGARAQRDSLVSGLYTLLFSYIVETANHKLSPGLTPPASGRSYTPAPIILLDIPGFTTRASQGTGTLISAASGGNGFPEFVTNFQDEILQSFLLRHNFDDDVPPSSDILHDGVHLPTMTIMDNLSVIELLRGAPVTGDPRSVMGKRVGGVLGVMNKAATSARKGSVVSGEDMVQELVGSFGGSPGFIQPTADPFASTASFGSSGAPPASRRFANFGINHYSGPITYGVHDWVENDADNWDAGFVRALRSSGEGFVKRLVSGPGIASESHVNDPSIVVRAQVSIRPIRTPTLLAGSQDDEKDKAFSLDPSKAYPITTQQNSVLSYLLSQLERSAARVWTALCIRPNDSGLSNSFDKRRVRAQLQSLGLADLVGRKQNVWVHGYTTQEFLHAVGMHSGSIVGGPEDGIRAFASGERWVEGVDFVFGKTKVWVNWNAWRDVDDRARVTEEGMRATSPSRAHGDDDDDMSAEGGAPSELHGWGRGTVGRRSIGSMAFGASHEDLLYGGGGLLSADPTQNFNVEGGNNYNPGWNGSNEWDKGSADGYTPPAADKKNKGAIEMSQPAGKHGYANLPGGDGSTAALATKEKGKMASKPVEVIPTTRARRWWVRFVWMCTWWIPSFLLSWVGGMKRSDIRMAWREKVTICMLIFGLCASIIFYVIFFGKLLCPEFDHAWDANDLKGHDSEDNFWVSIAGSVYDITNFIQGDHSVPGRPMTPDVTMPYAGTDLTTYFPPPLDLACAGLVTSHLLEMRWANATSAPIPAYAIHTSGALQTLEGTRLTSPTWYTDRFLPKMKQFYKGPLVWGPKLIHSAVNDGRFVAIIDQKLYDLSDYLQTYEDTHGQGGYDYLNSDIVALFKQQVGQDITKNVKAILDGLDDHQRAANKACLNNRFYIGRTDFRKDARCTVQGYLLVTFSAIIAVTILIKFLAALQLTSKRTPELLDKFIICQVPCYTEGEESLRRTIDSLAGLKYDDKRKLLFIICDGNIVGSGNDRPTPRIVLDILGVDPSLDPEPLMFRSIGEGSKQLNYGKVYSGLYEFEGHVVPYMVVVKVGKPSERQRPGNRGKRDSQILLLHYLNRVHFDAPMYPLELEMYHQMHNIIGIDPAFYEYIFMVDADTTVTPDSLNRLVAVTSDDSKVIAVCGETKLDNEDGSWWTMIQVYEYYISHHLAKAFESLFGSVTCLPGCFSMYRIRTADKGRPLIISNRIIDEYSECNVDTLHKKNLLQLGEDRYLTTIMMKHFPLFKMKFTPDAIAHTVAPDRWSVLLSQRRRWINSTIHNLLELIGLGELCGFCCFSMRFIVFVDLLGTLILPATAVYLVYLIVVVATKQAPIPIISLAMIGAVYGLQAVIFLLKREFMLIGWMIIYILAYPVYSFFLPIYSFWSMDDFSWGNTRIVVGEGKDKKVILQDDEGFDESVIPLKKFSEYQAEAIEFDEHKSVSGGSRPESRARSVAPPYQSHSRPGSRAASPSPGGDYYRDTNVMHNSSSNPNLRLAAQSHRSASSMGMPQLPSMPFSGPAASEQGHMRTGSFGAMSMGTMPMPMAGFGMMGGPGEFGTLPYAGSAYAGSAYGGTGPAAPRNSVMTNLNMFGTGTSGGFGATMPGGGGGPPSSFPSAFGQQQRPMSTFSMATSINPLMSAPSQNPNPTDEELLSVLRMYLSTQDLMTVTKKTAREAVMARFPKADLSSKKDFLNQSIEKILSDA
ncbi:Chitin synthase 6; AltName: Full=Chitin-UDP acetyl-glucosaminyl transferase 6; AltName: Full=Class-V chitin synthase 6 [Serendipita indica DSM 11827]|nr:Chitin synthase 6; AltName: Full=Chitin-UDP acetyl-glucosaminyl transferase 6; AltName: Full=Class-V chitin synthase 6 [Serendipita indica DSM 11827]